MTLLQSHSNFTIASLKEQYANNKLTPLQVMETIIEQAEQEENYNIWITKPTKELVLPYIEALQEKDKSLPLWGIPFAIKDNIDVAGMPTTAGCEAFTYTPEKHAFVVKCLIDAGAIPIGKTNLDQFATGLVGTRSPYGVCKNAINPELISGGSSSGSAVAVARGQVCFALGTDTAGSGRVPAALNGLIGFKPSLGAWSNNGVVPACESLDCVTVLANVYEDALLVDTIVRGMDEQNSWSQNRALQPLRLPKKVIFLKQEPTFFGEFEQVFENAWEAAKAQIQQLNIPIEYIDGDYLQKAALMLYEGPFVAERWAALAEFVQKHPEATNPVVEKILRRAEKQEYTATALYQAQHQLQQYKAKVQQDLRDAVLIMPTVGGTWRIVEVEKNPIETNSQLGLYTNHCNLLDLCAVNIPVKAPQPFGITLFALGGEDHLLHALSSYYLQGAVPTSQKTTKLAVCGLHLKGYPLERQMLEFGAVYVETTNTAAVYRLLKLTGDTARPGLVYNEQHGAEIEVDIWEMADEQLARFLHVVKAPLALGKITLKNDEEVLGFVCAASAYEYEDITASGGWRYAT